MTISTDVPMHELELQSETGAGGLDWILVEGLEFETIIGIHPQEREQPQPLIIDMQLGVVSIRDAVETESIDTTIDYQQVCELVMDHVQQARYQLVETLAERVAELLFARFAVERVVLRVRKPLALPYARGVGVAIARSRPSTTVSVD